MEALYYDGLMPMAVAMSFTSCTIVLIRILHRRHQPPENVHAGPVAAARFFDTMVSRSSRRWTPKVPTLLSLPLLYHSLADSIYALSLCTLLVSLPGTSIGL